MAKNETNHRFGGSGLLQRLAEEDREEERDAVIQALKERIARRAMQHIVVVHAKIGRECVRTG